MKCPGCDFSMEAKRIERRNCIRVEYTCPFCKYRDFDFEGISSMRTGDNPQISKSSFMLSSKHKGNPPRTDEMRARDRERWQRRKLRRLAKRHD